MHRPSLAQKERLLGKGHVYLRESPSAISFPYGQIGVSICTHKVGVNICEYFRHLLW